MALNRIPKLKIIVIGESGVGKTCLMMRYKGDGFCETKATVGATCEQKTHEIDGVKVNLAVWDTAGTEMFRTVSPMYYRGCHGAILVYDVTDMGSLYKLESWLNELEMYGTFNNMARMIVGNKIDELGLQQQKGISRTNEGLRFANKHHAMFTLTLAKTGEGVKDAFEELVRKIMETEGLWDRSNTAEAVVLFNTPTHTPTPAESSCSC